MAARADIAVVIPTRDRESLLRRCLEALAGQTHPPAEVIVVDDGSARPLDSALAGYRDRLPLRILRNSVSAGPAHARNAGWKESRSRMVAFTDDDCRPDSQWLERLHAAGGNGRLVVGRTAADSLDGPIRSVFDRTFEAHGLSWGFSTCNILYPRGLLEKLTGFDEQYRAAWAEDLDLAYRAIETGAEAVYAPEAVVYHAVHRRGMWPTIRERWRTGQIVRAARRHPDHRSSIFLDGRFWKPYHRRLLGAAAGGALLSFSPVFVLLAVPWAEDAVQRLREETYKGQSPGPLRLGIDVAGLAVLDAVEVASCAYWSYRERVLLL